MIVILLLFYFFNLIFHLIYAIEDQEIAFRGSLQQQAARYLPIPKSSDDQRSSKVPLVYIYLMGKECEVFPDYIKHSLLQAVRTQKNVMDVILISNFKECPSIFDSIKDIPFLLTVDSDVIASNATKTFDEMSEGLFSGIHFPFLWKSSALRLFLLLDFMQLYHHDEALHIEADNLLYHPLNHEALTVLRQHYPLALTVLTANRSMMTASVLWVAQIKHLIELINYLTLLAQRQNPDWQHYINFLRRYACCKKGGIEPDPNTGLGIKPYALNEMSMLANYQSLHEDVLKGLPLLPAYPAYPKMRYFTDLSSYAPGGQYVGVAVGAALWDSGSYGQYLGGTKNKGGENHGFVDSSHVIGQAFIAAQCEVQMLCHRGNNPSQPREMTLEERSRLQNVTLLTSELMLGECYSAPFVRCQASELKERASWIPLWNLHIHSKQTEKYVSKPCPCSSER